MNADWLITPAFFEVPEPGLAAIAPEGATTNPHLPPDRSAEGLRPTYDTIRSFVTQTAQTGRVPVSLAGDCCAAMPVLAGLQAAEITPHLIWIDAHGDFNTPETSPSQFLGGMPLAMLTGRGPQDWCRIAKVAPIADAQVALVDGRDLDPGEADLLEASGVSQIALRELAGLTVSGPVHLHVDVDVVSADTLPVFNYPAPGGPEPEELIHALAQAVKVFDVCAVSISGWNGALDADGRAARAFGEALAPWGARVP